jgi:uncharacterized protein (TIGR00251 family)
MIDRRTRLMLRVSPGAKRSTVVGRHGEAWKIRVAAPPLDGRANLSLETFLATVLEVGRDQLRIVTGASGRDKIVEVAGRDADEVDRLLAAAANGKDKRDG